MLPEITERVARYTADEIDERIARRTRENIARYAADGPAAIERRLDELDREWDIDRTLEANASTLMLVGLGLGSWVDRRYFLLPAAVAGFLLQHALQGWCPPVPLLRRLGVRSHAEIEQERYALKVLRGDFRHAEGAGESVAESGNIVRQVVQAVQR